MNLTNKDKILLLVVSSFCVVLLGYNYVFLPTESEITRLTERIYEYRNLMVDKVPVVEKLQVKEAENNRLMEQMKTMQEGGGRTLSQQEFLVFLSSVCNKHNVDVTHFSDLGTVMDEYVTKSDFDFGLRGGIANINAILSEIDALGIRYSVSSVSFRQDKTLPYLARSFDSLTNLEWYDKESTADSNAVRLCLTLEFISYEVL